MLPWLAWLCKSQSSGIRVCASLSNPDSFNFKNWRVKTDTYWHVENVWCVCVLQNKPPGLRTNSWVLLRRLRMHPLSDLGKHQCWRLDPGLTHASGPLSNIPVTHITTSYSKSLGRLSLSWNYRFAFPALPGLLGTQPSDWLFASTSGTLCRKKTEAGLLWMPLLTATVWLDPIIIYTWRNWGHGSYLPTELQNGTALCTFSHSTPLFSILPFSTDVRRNCVFFTIDWIKLRQRRQAKDFP